MANTPLISGIGGSVEKGDLVFFKCSNPAVGVVTRIAKNKTWVEVKWIDMERIHKKAHRVKMNWVEKLNPVLNYWNVQIGVTQASSIMKQLGQYKEPTLEPKREEFYD